MFKGEVTDTARGIEGVAFGGNAIGGAGVDAARTGAAMVGNRRGADVVEPMGGDDLAQ